MWGERWVAAQHRAHQSASRSLQHLTWNARSSSINPVASADLRPYPSWCVGALDLAFVVHADRGDGGHGDADNGPPLSCMCRAKWYCTYSRCFIHINIRAGR